MASPIIIDLVILCEMCERITFRVGEDKTFQSFNPVLSILSYLLKAPLVPKSTPVVNALFKQRSCIENIFRLVDYDSYHEVLIVHICIVKVIVCVYLVTPGGGCNSWILPLVLNMLFFNISANVVLSVKCVYSFSSTVVYAGSSYTLLTLTY